MASHAGLPSKATVAATDLILADQLALDDRVRTRLCGNGVARRPGRPKTAPTPLLDAGVLTSARCDVRTVAPLEDVSEIRALLRFKRRAGIRVEPAETEALDLQREDDRRAEHGSIRGQSGWLPDLKQPSHSLDQTGTAKRGIRVINGPPKQLTAADLRETDIVEAASKRFLESFDMMSPIGLTPKLHTVLLGISGAKRAELYSRVVERFVRRVKARAAQDRSRKSVMEAKGVFGGAANEQRILTQLNLAQQRKFGALSLHGIRSEVLDEIFTELAAQRGLTKADVRDADRSISRLFQGTAFEGLSHRGRMRIQQSRQLMTIDGTELAMRMAGYWGRKLLAKARATIARRRMDEEATKSGVPHPQLHAESGQPGGRLEVAQLRWGGRGSKSGSELAAGTRRGRVARGVAGAASAAELLQSARDRAARASQALTVGAGGAGSQSGSRPHTIDPSSRSQPVWLTREGGRGTSDRSRVRLWGVGHGMFDEVTAPLVPVPSLVKHLAGRHLPRQSIKLAEAADASQPSVCWGLTASTTDNGGQGVGGCDGSISAVRAADWGVWGSSDLQVEQGGAEIPASRPLTVQRRPDRRAFPGESGQQHQGGSRPAAMGTGSRVILREALTPSAPGNGRVWGADSSVHSIKSGEQILWPQGLHSPHMADSIVSHEQEPRITDVATRGSERAALGLSGVLRQTMTLSRPRSVATASSLTGFECHARVFAHTAEILRSAELERKERFETRRRVEQSARAQLLVLSRQSTRPSLESTSHLPVDDVAQSSGVGVGSRKRRGGAGSSSSRSPPTTARHLPRCTPRRHAGSSIPTSARSRAHSAAHSTERSDRHGPATEGGRSVSTASRLERRLAAGGVKSASETTTAATIRWQFGEEVDFERSLMYSRFVTGVSRHEPLQDVSGSCNLVLRHHALLP